MFVGLRRVQIVRNEDAARLVASEIDDFDNDAPKTCLKK